MERRSTKTTNLGEEIANIGGSAHTRFNHTTIKITAASENSGNRGNRGNQNEGIIGFKFVANADCDLLNIKPAQKIASFHASRARNSNNKNKY